MSRYFEIKEGSLEHSIVQNIQEKSVSVAQQKAAGLALAAKRGEKDPDELQGPSKEMMKMSEKDLEDFAKTKHKGLPMKKEETEVAEKYDVKTAKSKMGKITVKSFDSLDDAKAHLEKMKQKGEKGIISQNGKPVTESKEEYKKVFDAALKKFNVSSPGDFKTDELKKKFFNYVDANYKAKNEETEVTEHLEESDMKSAMKKLLGRDAKTSTSGASGFQKTMYHVNDDMYVTFNDKSNLGDVYYKGKNVDSFRGVGSPDMEKVVKKYMKKYGVKSEESGSKTMTGKPWSQIKVEK